MALSPTLWDPSCGLTYAEWLKDKSPQTRPSGWTHHTKDQTREYVGKDGHRVKDTTDQLGNRVVQHGHGQQSVEIRRPETVRAVIPRAHLPNLEG